MLLVSISVFTSCGNILIRSNPESEVHLAQFEKPKTLTIRHGAKIVENRYKRNYGFGYEPLSEHDSEEVEKIFKNVSSFKLRKVNGLDRAEFKKDDVEAAKEFLERGSFDSESDLQLNIYTEHRYGHSLMIYPYLVWTAGHIVTLGLLPIRIPQEFSYFGDIRSSSGNILYTFEKTCQANTWAWSPLLLAGHWDRPYIALEAFKKDCILSILADAQKKL